MLRLNHEFSADAPNASDASAPPPPAVTIIQDFENPYLELIRLLHESSEIEHSLMVQYLYAAFSIKPEFGQLRGGSYGGGLMGIAIQEMQHFYTVNKFLVALGAAPKLIRQDFPYETAVYPFPFELAPLGPYSLAKYVYVEAPSGKVSDDSTEPPEFLAKLRRYLGSMRPNHLGSLYKRIVEVIDELLEPVAGPRSGCPLDSGALTGFRGRMVRIQEEGEGPHFEFFKNVLMGNSHGLTPTAWDDPNAQEYPANPCLLYGTAYPGVTPQDGKTTIQGEANRKLGWLSNFHYWITLFLIDLACRSEADGTDISGVLREQAVSHMTGPLWTLGAELATRNVGLPFDLLSIGFSPGKTTQDNFRILRALLREAMSLGIELGHPPDTCQDTLDALAGL